MRTGILERGSVPLLVLLLFLLAGFLPAHAQLSGFAANQDTSPDDTVGIPPEGDDEICDDADEVVDVVSVRFMRGKEA